MSAGEQRIIDHFLALQRAMTMTDAAAVARLFAPAVIEANPAETRYRVNDDIFRAAIEERLSYLMLAGMRDVKALEIDPLPLGANYSLVRVRWSVWFAPIGRPDFVDEFQNDYLVRLDGDRTQIVVSIAHDDDPSIMRRIGLGAGA